MLERRQKNFVVKMLLLHFLSIYFCLANNTATCTYEEEFFLFLQYLPYVQDVPCIMGLVYMFPLLLIGYTSTFSYASSYS